MVNKYRSIINDLRNMDLIFDAIECEFEEMIKFFIRIKHIS